MTISRRSSSFVAVLGIVASALAAQHPASAQDRAYAIEPVAVTGEQAPGTGGLNFGRVEFADLNDSGLVAINGALGDLGSYDEGIWVGPPGNISLIARAGDLAPGAAALSFYQFGWGTLANASGEAALYATCKVDGVLSACSGLWTGSAGNLQLLVLGGEPAPGAGGHTFSSYNFEITSIDDLGTTTFNAGIDTAEGYHYGSGIWKGMPGALEPVALTGDPAPDTDGLYFTEVGGLFTNSSGTSVITAFTDDPNFTSPSGYWKTGTGGLKLIAKVGDEAPGTAGRIFGNLATGSGSAGGIGWPVTDAPDVADFSGPVLNELGHVVFNGFLEPLDPNAVAGEEGIWIQDETSLQLVAIIGDPAPGLEGLQFTDFNHVNFNSQGQVAFDAALNSADPGVDHGIWRGLPGSLSLLVREGDPAPGTSGETFKYLTYGPSMNDTGEIVFQARLSSSAGDGIWVAGTDGRIELILREGEVLKVKDGDYRTIQTVGIGDGLPSSMSAYNRFNEAGQIVLAVEFTDGTDGVFLASPLAISTNLPPVANAGSDLSVPEGYAITVDGSGSFDPEGTVLTFVWSIGGVEVATGPRYNARGLAAGTHAVTLTVTDRSGASASDEMILTVTPNLPPVAYAGPDQTVSHIQSATLNGTGSSDPEGAVLSYVWNLDGAQIATGASATVGPFAVGKHMITLTVTDDIGKTASDSMIVTVINQAPIASAGPDRIIQTLQSVWLDGAGSSDPEGEVLTYVWTLDGAQIGSGPRPTVGPFDAGVYTVTLTVTDGHGASATDETVVTVLNRAPIADAGFDQTVNHVTPISLDGSGSSDPEGGALTYAWSIDGVEVATGANASVGPFTVGTYTVTLTVTDNHGATATDSMAITVVNEAPVANAGPDQTVTFKGRNATVTLDGSASTDPEGGVLSYLWLLDGQTIGTDATVQTNLTAGIYIFYLSVIDDHGAANVDSVVITVSR